MPDTDNVKEVEEQDSDEDEHVEHGKPIYFHTEYHLGTLLTSVLGKQLLSDMLIKVALLLKSVCAFYDSN